jgi:hypothetical protein
MYAGVPMTDGPLVLSSPNPLSSLLIARQAAMHNSESPIGLRSIADAHHASTNHLQLFSEMTNLKFQLSV